MRMIKLTSMDGCAIYIDALQIESVKELGYGSGDAKSYVCMIGGENVLKVKEHAPDVVALIEAAAGGGADAR